MRAYFLITFCVLASFVPVKGQIMADSITDRLPLASNKNVKALLTDLTATFDEIRVNHAWKAYDTKDTITPETALWLAFELENRSKDTVYTHFYRVDRNATVYQQSERGFKRVENGNY